jgi:hypothetical protein
VKVRWVAVPRGQTGIYEGGVDMSEAEGRASLWRGAALLTNWRDVDRRDLAAEGKF